MLKVTVLQIVTLTAWIKWWFKRSNSNFKICKEEEWLMIDLQRILNPIPFARELLPTIWPTRSLKDRLSNKFSVIILRISINSNITQRRIRSFKLVSKAHFTMCLQRRLWRHPKISQVAYIKGVKAITTMVEELFQVTKWGLFLKAERGFKLVQ